VVVVRRGLTAENVAATAKALDGTLRLDNYGAISASLIYRAFVQQEISRCGTLGDDAWRRLLPQLEKCDALDTLLICGSYANIANSSILLCVRILDDCITVAEKSLLESRQPDHARNERAIEAATQLTQVIHCSPLSP